MSSWFYFLALVNGFSPNGLSRPQSLSSETGFLNLLSIILNWFLGFVGVVAFLIFLWAGFTYIVSSGKAESVKKAKTMMIYAMVGIVVILLAYAAIATLTDAFSPAATIPDAIPVQATAVGSVPVGTAVPVPATAMPPTTVTVNPDNLGRR
ncbi:hypothetical protein KA517_04085 [Candidatus Gracilibacteria bacterium]|nr:hypothetical protein [Candidatus Gracilibacteria bacterium]